MGLRSQISVYSSKQISKCKTNGIPPKMKILNIHVVIPNVMGFLGGLFCCFLYIKAILFQPIVSFKIIH